MAPRFEQVEQVVHQGEEAPRMMMALRALRCVIVEIQRAVGDFIRRPVPAGILRELQHEHGADLQVVACYCPGGFAGRGGQCEGCGHARDGNNCLCASCDAFKPP